MNLSLYKILLIGSVLALSWLCALHVLLHKRDPRSALVWIALCISLPAVGPVAYFLFGINRVQTRARKLHHNQAINTLVFPFGENYCSGNQVTALFGQQVAYPAILAAINGAVEQVLVSTYIFRPDAAGQQFVAALNNAVKRGVRVCLLIDGIGELYTWQRVAPALIAGGVEVRRYLPPRLIPPALHINLRNHRKIIVVDGLIAFTGGMNIGGTEVFAERDDDQAQDVHFSIQGPAVRDLAVVFGNDWSFSDGDPLPAAPPVVEPVYGDAQCRLVVDGPDRHLDELVLRILGAIGAANHCVTIMTPYFLPTRELTGALKAAAVNGVTVRVILPRKSNLPFVDWATRNMLWELLRIGIEVYFLPPPFRHTKVLLIDSDYTMLGSANWDSRSLRLNFEAAIEVRCPHLNAVLGKHCQQAIALSQRTSLAKLDARPLLTKFRDALSWLASPYL